jgi:hypothetical protein
MSLDELFQQFLSERTYVYNVTPKTRDWYQSAWQAFKRSRSHLATDCEGRPSGPVSCNTWLRAMNAFCRWLHEQGEAPTMVKLRQQRLEKRIIRTHDEAVLRVVLTIAPRDGGRWHQRNALRSYYCLTKRLGLPRSGFHRLRHTFATHTSATVGKCCGCRSSSGIVTYPPR